MKWTYSWYKYAVFMENHSKNDWSMFQCPINEKKNEWTERWAVTVFLAWFGCAFGYDSLFAHISLDFENFGWIFTQEYEETEKSHILSA